MKDPLIDHVVIGHLLVQVSDGVFALVVKIEFLLFLFVSDLGLRLL